eukprot:754708-Hanusia_phi.AAC.1
MPAEKSALEHCGEEREDIAREKQRVGRAQEQGASKTAGRAREKQHRRQEHPTHNIELGHVPGRSHSQPADPAETIDAYPHHARRENSQSGIEQGVQPRRGVGRRGWG